MFRIVVEEITAAKDDSVFEGGSIKRYEQVIDSLDIGKLAAFLNSKPRKRRAPKEKT